MKSNLMVSVAIDDHVVCMRTGWEGRLVQRCQQLCVIETNEKIEGAYRSPGELWRFATQMKYLGKLVDG